jgi:hypothetical protein
VGVRWCGVGVVVLEVGVGMSLSLSQAAVFSYLISFTPYLLSLASYLVFSLTSYRFSLTSHLRIHTWRVGRYGHHTLANGYSSEPAWAIQG